MAPGAWSGNASRRPDSPKRGGAVAGFSKCHLPGRAKVWDFREPSGDLGDEHYSAGACRATVPEKQNCRALLRECLSDERCEPGRLTGRGPADTARGVSKC